MVQTQVRLRGLDRIISQSHLPSECFNEPWLLSLSWLHLSLHSFAEADSARYVRGAMPTEMEFRLWIKLLLRFQMIEIRVGTGWMLEGIYLRQTAVSIERISALPVRGVMLLSVTR
jgi:hypothetical protein